MRLIISVLYTLDLHAPHPIFSGSAPVPNIYLSSQQFQYFQIFKSIQRPLMGVTMSDIEFKNRRFPLSLCCSKEYLMPSCHMLTLRIAPCHVTSFSFIFMPLRNVCIKDHIEYINNVSLENGANMSNHEK